MAFERKNITLVTENRNWWKQRKYRRETARTLRALRRQGWRLDALERLERTGVDTRKFTLYRLRRPVT